jgi:hypothetical protein
MPQKPKRFTAMGTAKTVNKRESKRICCRMTPKPLPPVPMPFPPGAFSSSGSKAVLAIYGPVASRLKRYRGLFPAPGTGDRGALWLTPSVVSSATGLFVLLCLAARLASFWSRIATLLEKCLIFA